MAGIEVGPGKSQVESLALALGWGWRVREVACARELGTTNNNTTIRVAEDTGHVAGWDGWVDVGSVASGCWMAPVF